MTIGCFVPGCTNNNKKDKRIGVKRHYYSVPSIITHQGEKTQEVSTERRNAWITAINREKEPTKHSFVCSDHFVTGKSAALFERDSPDWVPSLKLVPTEPTRKNSKTTKLPVLGMVTQPYRPFSKKSARLRVKHSVLASLVKRSRLINLKSKNSNTDTAGEELKEAPFSDGETTCSADSNNENHGDDGMSEINKIITAQNNTSVTVDPANENSKNEKSYTNSKFAQCVTRIYEDDIGFAHLAKDVSELPENCLNQAQRIRELSLYEEHQIADFDLENRARWHLLSRDLQKHKCNASEDRVGINVEVTFEQPGGTRRIDTRMIISGLRMLVYMLLLVIRTYKLENSCLKQKCAEQEEYIERLENGRAQNTAGTRVHTVHSEHIKSANQKRTAVVTRKRKRKTAWKRIKRRKVTFASTKTSTSTKEPFSNTDDDENDDDYSPDSEQSNANTSNENSPDTEQPATNLNNENSPGFSNPKRKKCFLSSKEDIDLVLNQSSKARRGLKRAISFVDRQKQKNPSTGFKTLELNDRRRVFTPNQTRMSFSTYPLPIDTRHHAEKAITKTQQPLSVGMLTKSTRKPCNVSVHSINSVKREPDQTIVHMILGEQFVNDVNARTLQSTNLLQLNSSVSLTNSTNTHIHSSETNNHCSETNNHSSESHNHIPETHNHSRNEQW